MLVDLREIIALLSTEQHIIWDHANDHTPYVELNTTDGFAFF